MNIRDISKKYNISVRTIRYYEELNLIKAERNSSNIREFSQVEINKLEIILILKSLNFSLKEIDELLNEQDEKDLIELIEEKAHEVQKEINTLNNTKQSLYSIITLIHQRGLEKLNIMDFIKEQIYINKNNERMLVMNKDELIIEIGEKLIPFADKQQDGSLLDAIKLLREKMDKESGLKLPLIRVRDNMKDLKASEFRIINGSDTLVEKDLEGEDILSCSSIITEELRLKYEELNK